MQVNLENWRWKTPVTFGALKCFLSCVGHLKGFSPKFVSSVLYFQETLCGIVHNTLSTCRAPIMILSVFWLKETVVTFGAPKIFLSPVSPLVNFMTEVERLLSHLLHWNGFSLVWVLSCFFLSNLILRSSYHTLCTWRVSHLSLWVLSCIFKKPYVE